MRVIIIIVFVFCLYQFVLCVFFVRCIVFSLVLHYIHVDVYTTETPGLGCFMACMGEFYTGVGGERRKMSDWVVIIIIIIFCIAAAEVVIWAQLLRHGPSIRRC